MSRRGGSEVVVIMWRDIPAQINGKAGADKHQVILLSANPQYPPRYIMESEEFQIWGVYIGLCRVGRASG